MKTLFKTLANGLKSAHGNCAWKIGEWKQVKGKPVLCENGFHCSERVLDAMGYIWTAFIARVEVAGESLAQADKSVHQKMRLVEVWEWKKEDSVSLAIFAAKLVIGIYEKKYPGEDRPREAIEAAKKWLADPTEKNSAAANAAANAAYAAAHAAASAAAYAAANAAYAAAHAANAAHAAYAAANAAASAAANAAANAAALEATLSKIEAWIQKRLSEKTPITGRAK